jgi:hypothetical protein
MESRYIDPEDEAFNEIERQAKQRKETVRANLQSLVHNPFRNDVIEEVAQHIEQMRGFGQDTISSFAIYIRGMKR